MKSRYPGTYWFTKEQSDIFFGRENDIDKLQILIENEKQILLYANSGVGKTSLLHAGVFPGLPEHYQMIEVRFNTHVSTDSIPPLTRILDKLERLYPDLEKNAKTLLDLVTQNDEDRNSLWYRFKKIQLMQMSQNLAEMPVILLVFDQFEELFSYPKEDIVDFKNQIYELTEISLPNKYNKYLADKRDDFPDLITRESVQALQKPMQIKTLFSIRSDKLNLLNKLADKLPNIQRKFMELLPLSNEQAQKAITEPANATGDFSSRPFVFSERALSKIMRFLTSNGTQDVESIQLQIICQRIEKQDDEDGIIQDYEVPNFNNIFLEFYNSAIAKVHGDEEQAAARRLIEDEFIFNNQRVQLDEIVCKKFVRSKTIKILVGTYLLRAKENLNGKYSYELSHDTLIAPINEAAEKRKQEEEQIRLEAKRLKELKIAQQKAEQERIEREKEHKRQEEILRLQTEKTLSALKAVRLAEENAENQKKARMQQEKLLYIIIFVALASVAIAIMGFMQLFQARRALVQVNEMKRKLENVMFDNVMVKKFPKWREIPLMSSEKQKILEKVEDINLESNEISNLPDGIFKCKNLTYLNLNLNLIKEIPDSLSKLNKIEVLQLETNDFEEIPKAVYQLKKLSTLSFHQNKIGNISKEIKNLKNLINLNFSKNRIEKLPEEFYQLIKLKHLDLNSNQLTNLDKKFEKFNQLQYIDLSNNELTEINFSFKTFTHLKQINFQNNENLSAKSVFAAFKDFPRPLRVSSHPEKGFNPINQFSILKISLAGEIPQNLNQIKNLVEIDVSNIENLNTDVFFNAIKDIKRPIVLTNKKAENAINDTVLLIKINPKIDITGDYIKLKNLKILRLSASGIDFLSDNIGNLTQLTEINLFSNELKKLPESIGLLSNLEILNLSTNELTALPDTIVNLVNLKILNISNNHIKTLPKDIGKLKNLKKIYIKGNPIDETERKRLDRILPRDIYIDE